MLVSAVIRRVSIAGVSRLHDVFATPGLRVPNKLTLPGRLIMQADFTTVLFEDGYRQLKWFHRMLHLEYVWHT